MPFYEALKYIIDLSPKCKARRSDWPVGQYICKGFNQDCMSIVYIKFINGKFTYSAYNASPRDMTANDWVIITED